MREIKFRVKLTDLFTRTELYINYSLDRIIDGNLWDESRYVHKVVGQYTGLKDKNGVEIYEGDIVEAWSAGANAKCEVKWGQGKAGFFLYRYPHIAWNLSGGGPEYNQEAIEIIGNIHQNPELIASLNK